ncbi:hypothetical protein ACWEQL_21610, partial [Kitasatospora sp. NPDC004240]
LLAGPPPSSPAPARAGAGRWLPPPLPTARAAVPGGRRPTADSSASPPLLLAVAPPRPPQARRPAGSSLLPVATELENRELAWVDDEPFGGDLPNRVQLWTSGLAGRGESPVLAGWDDFWEMLRGHLADRTPHQFACHLGCQVMVW